MARPKIWKNEAERKRMARQSGRNPDAEAANPDASMANPDADGIETAVSPVNPDANPDAASNPDAPLEVEAPPRQPSGFVAFRDQAHVPHDGPLWAGAGRGTPRTYQGAPYVLVARGTVDPDQLEHGVVTLADWSARLAQHCAHSLAGWSCHAC